jgi:hypothetical protein
MKEKTINAFIKSIFKIKLPHWKKIHKWRLYGQLKFWRIYDNRMQRHEEEKKHFMEKKSF